MVGTIATDAAAANLVGSELRRATRLAHYRDPHGRRLTRFCWAVWEQELWHMPVTLTRLPRAELAGRLLPYSLPTFETGVAFWFAVAARQDLWRALRAVRGLHPVVRVPLNGGRPALGAALCASHSPLPVVRTLDAWLPKAQPDHWLAFAEMRASSRSNRHCR